MKHYFTADLHVAHGNIMKYCGRTSFMSDEERSLFARWQKDEKSGRAWKDKDRFDFKLSPESVDRMDDAIIDNINRLVGADDVLWDLGDWCFGRDERQYLNIARATRRRIRCKTVHQIWGNHDRPDVIAKLFQSDNQLVSVAIADSGEYWFDGQGGYTAALKSGRATAVVLCHYAMLVWDQSHRGSFQLFGHSHGAIEDSRMQKLPQLRQMDVGVDNAFRLLGEYRPFEFSEIYQRLSRLSGKF